MLNATLILLALCLRLGWQFTSTVHSAADAFALRGDIGAIQASALDAQLASMQLFQSQLNTQMEGLETRFDKLEDQYSVLATQPEALIDYAFDRASEMLNETLTDLALCARPSTSDSLF